MSPFLLAIFYWFEFTIAVPNMIVQLKIPKVMFYGFSKITSSSEPHTHGINHTISTEKCKPY